MTAGGVVIAGLQEEARPLEVDVGLVETHVAALGNLLGLAEVGRGSVRGVAQTSEDGAGQETAGDVVFSAGLTQSVDSPVQVIQGLGEVRRRTGRQGQAEMGASEGEVVEGDVENPIVTLSDFDGVVSSISNVLTRRLVGQAAPAD